VGGYLYYRTLEYGSKTELKFHILKEFSDAKLWFETYGNLDWRGFGKRNTILHRAIEKIGYTTRQLTISQKVPAGWKELVEQGVKRVRESLIQHNIEVVLAADETFVHFHERGTTVLAPVGEKRIGSTCKIDDKAGCTLVPTMDFHQW
jgi:hypothetical protein